MGYIPGRKKLWPRLSAVLLGNLAISLFFLPFVCKGLHRLRGVRFTDAKSVFIGRGVLLDNWRPELITIGADVWLTGNCIVLSHGFCSEYQHQHYGMDEVWAPVVFEDGVFIGAGSVILPGVTIGKGSHIGAGSVVIDSMPPGVLAAGNPARIIRRLDQDDDRPEPPL